MWFHAHADSGKAKLPANEWVRPARWCSAPTPATRSGEVVSAGEVIEIEPRSLHRAPPALTEHDRAVSAAGA